MLKRKQKIGLMDARIFRYWQALYLAFYSRRLYVDVAKRWKGFGLMYCLLVMTIAVIPLSIKSVINFNQFVGSDLITPISKIPKLNILDGNVLFDGKMPYIIKNDTGQDVIMIDTTGSVTSISEKNPDLVMLITKDKYFFRAPKLRFLAHDSKNKAQFDAQETEVYPLGDISNGIFDASAWIKTSGLIMLKNGIMAIIYPFLVSSMFGIFVTVLAVLAMMGQVASQTIFKYKLNFKTACRIMMVSSSIGTSLFLCLKAAELNSVGMNMLCMILIFGYFSFAVLSIKRESKQLVHV